MKTLATQILILIFKCYVPFLKAKSPLPSYHHTSSQIGDLPVPHSCVTSFMDGPKILTVDVKEKKMRELGDL
jgi:hypothetical protein